MNLISTEFALLAIETGSPLSRQHFCEDKQQREATQIVKHSDGEHMSQDKIKPEMG